MDYAFGTPRTAILYKVSISRRAPGFVPHLARMGKPLPWRNRLLATASRAQQVQLWDPGTGHLLHTFEGGGYTVAFSSDGHLLASGDLFYNGINAHVWNPRTGKLLQVLKGHTEGPIDIAFSPDGHMLATGAGDGTIRLWGVPAP
jgi:WD40 repeat protein